MGIKTAVRTKPRATPTLESTESILPDKFMGVDVPLEEARFVILLLPYEKTTCHKKGTVHGPARFIEGSLGCELFDEELGTLTYKSGLHTLPPFAPHEQAETFFARLEARVAELIGMTRKTLFSIGGEHSLSQAIIPPFAKQYPGLSVLHFDAHADLRPIYEGSPRNHACALYPISRLCKTVQVGIRSVAEEEAPLINKGNVTTFLMHEHRDIHSLIPKVLHTLTDTVYLSIDLDGFDPSVIPGVGTPQPGGISWNEGLDLFRAVIETKKVVGLDIMELCPLQETVQSELAAAKLAYRLMGYLSRKNNV